ncbi:MAG: hypothetical protein U0641_17950 [Anaerolineae bacterium]
MEQAPAGGLAGAAIGPPTTEAQSRWQVWLLRIGPPLVFALLSVALTWPLVTTLTTRFIGVGVDPLSNTWTLWHVREAVLGHEPLFFVPRSFYPVGVPILTHLPGPLMGFVALPFWAWGAVGAYNAIMLLGVFLTGYCAYLLARDLDLAPGIALFTGVSLQLAAMPVAGLLGHTDKTLLGLLCLILLTFLRALNPLRSAWWGVVTGVLVLLAALDSGWHFGILTIALPYFFLVGLAMAKPGARGQVFRRGVVVGLTVIALVGPFVYLIVSTTRSLGISTEVGAQSSVYAPDLLEFFLPSPVSRFLGAWASDVGAALGVYAARPWSIERAVSLGWVSLALALVALLARVRAARPWLGFTLLMVVIALGPFLYLAGADRFTALQFRVPLPYSLVVAIPGFGFMRDPGRFMMMGFIGLSVAASYGLAWLTERVGATWRRPLLGGALALVLLQGWPQPWPFEAPRPAPAFYQQLASDPAMYGVFDVPLPYPGYTAYYEDYQMTHGKGISAGYISRAYRYHPVFYWFYSDNIDQPDFLVNGRPTNAQVNAVYDMAKAGYRYVVWHKPKPEYTDFPPGGLMDGAGQKFMQAALPGATPMQEDDLARVYALPAADEARLQTVTLTPTENWYARDGAMRWAQSPAKLVVASPQAGPAALDIEMAAVYDPGAASGARPHGVLTVQVGDGLPRDYAVTQGETLSLPLDLPAGNETVTLNLQAGNFVPAGSGSPDTRRLSFAIGQANLRTETAQ